jgi:hypothetical protein
MRNVWLDKDAKRAKTARSCWRGLPGLDRGCGGSERRGRTTIELALGQRVNPRRELL